MLTEKRQDQAAPDARGSRAQTITNWTLVLLTILGAAAAELVAYGLVLGTAACTDRTCPHLGLADAVYGPVVYGAPVVSVVAIAVSFVTASRRRGWVVPAIAWGLLIVGPVLLLVASH
jgi:hypothetical protein